MNNEMRKLGQLLYSFRMKYNLSRDKFCQGVCTSKYLYLIEKGDRTPSIQIIEAFNYKFGIDLYEYFQFLDYDNPILVKELLDQMDGLMVSREFDKLQRVTEEIQSIPDFSKPPLCFRVDYNVAWLLINKWKNYDRAMQVVMGALNQMGYPIVSQDMDYGFMTRPVMRGHGLLALCEIRKGDIKNGLLRMQMVYMILTQKKNMKSISHTYLSVGINYAYALILDGDYEKAVQISNELIDYQLKFNMLNRIYISYFTLGHALYLIGKRDEAKEWLLKCHALTYALGIVGEDTSFTEYDSMKWALNTNAKT